MPARLQTATGNLERVRKVKTRHQRLFSRVTAVREELQRFLEDDDDMVKMCLTRKRELEQAANQSGAGGEHCTPSALSGSPRAGMWAGLPSKQIIRACGQPVRSGRLPVHGACTAHRRVRPASGSRSRPPN